MNTAAVQPGNHTRLSARVSGLRCPRLDFQLLGVTVTLLAIGLVMVASASITTADRQFGDPFYYGLRQAIYLLAGIGVGFLVFKVRMAHWARAGVPVLLLALMLLLAVLIPGIGREVNGATRWIALGPVNLQVSEPAKLLLFIYLAGYLVRHAEEVRNQVSGFIKPMAVLCLAAILLLVEPDFGATVVLPSGETRWHGLDPQWFKIVDYERRHCRYRNRVGKNRRGHRRIPCGERNEGV